MQGGEAALHVACRRALPRQAVPAVFVVLEAMPLTPSGKVDPAALPLPSPPHNGRSAQPTKTLARSTDKTVPTTMITAPPQCAPGGAGCGHQYERDGGLDALPRTELERLVAGVWAEALRLPTQALPLRLADNFFALGGSSATAVQMVALLGDAEARAAAAATTQPTAHGGRRKAKASVTSDWSLADPRVRYCALFRKPRLVDYARFVGWAAVGAPTRSATDAAKFAAQLADGIPSAAEAAEAALALMERWAERLHPPSPPLN
jgi:hypothetical protein